MSLKVNGIGCYLAVVINLCNRQVVNWKLRRYHDSQLVVDALHHAMLNVTKTTKMMFHSDQGSIYGSQLLSQTAQTYGLEMPR